MATKQRAPRSPGNVMKAYTIRPDQAESIEIIATRIDGHYNRSQVVRDAIDAYIARHARAIESIRFRDTLDTNLDRE